MAEGGEPPIQKICNKSTIRSKELKTILHGDNVETKQESRAEEIGAVAASGSCKGSVLSKEEKMTPRGAELRATPRSSVRRRASEVQTTPEKIAQKEPLDTMIGRVRILISKAEYEAAISVLKWPGVLESHVYLTKLMIVECYLRSGNDLKGVELIDEMTKTMTSSELYFDDLLDSANDFIVNGFYIRAIILLRIVSDIYRYREKRSTLDGAVNGMHLCSEKIYSSTKQLIKSGNGRLLTIAVEYGIKYMKVILRSLISVKNASPDNKALKEAFLRYYIVGVLKMVGKDEKIMKYLKLGLEVLDQQLGVNALKYRVYGYMLNDLGSAYHKLREYSKAESHFERAVGAVEQATDFVSNIQKQRYTKITKYNLNMVCAQLGECSTSSSCTSDSVELWNNFAD